MSLNGVTTPSIEAVDNSFWSILREAVRGSNRDFTTETIGRSLFLLAVPMILEMVMESVFALVDVFFVGRLGPEAVAVVILTESIMALVYAVAFGWPSAQRQPLLDVSVKKTRKEPLRRQLT
jgi:hypothetical protein